MSISKTLRIMVLSVGQPETAIYLKKLLKNMCGGLDSGRDFRFPEGDLAAQIAEIRDTHSKWNFWLVREMAIVIINPAEENVLEALSGLRDELNREPGLCSVVLEMFQPDGTLMELEQPVS